MLEELTVQATKTLLTLFWLLITLIIIAAIASTKTKPKTTQ
jgi:hypothetical protein